MDIKSRYATPDLNFAKICILIITLVVGALIIIPIPAIILDILIILNIVFAIVLLLVVLFRKVENPIIFPTLLILSTIYCVSVKICAVRHILTQGDDFDGWLIRFVSSIVSGSGTNGVMIGFIIFIVITVFIVVLTIKGTIRTAEVNARYTLDITCQEREKVKLEFSSGLITKDDLDAKEYAILLKNNFFYAMEYASNFIFAGVKAVIYITAIIIIAGIHIDVLFREIHHSEALNTYLFFAAGTGILTMLPLFILSTTVWSLIFQDQMEQYKVDKPLKERFMEKGNSIPTPEDRDNILRLKKKGWTVDEISMALDFSKSEVELILEIHSNK